MFDVFRYSKSDELQWDEFVPTGNNGTLFHLRAFINYHPDERFIDHSLLIKKKGKLFAVFPAAEQIIDKNYFLVSHPGTTVGSFVVPENLSISDALKLTETLVSYAQSQNFFGIRITLPPNLYQHRLSNYMDFSFFKQKFYYLKRDITSILFLEQPFEKTIKKFRPSHIRAVRKAQENCVYVTQSNDFDSFFNILKKNLKIRHGVNPTHTLEEIKLLNKLFPEKINLFAAFLDETMIAGVVNFQINEHVVLAFYISHDEEHADSRAVNLLFYKIFEWALNSNFQIYDFGIFTINGQPNMGLGRFKENFGASGIFRDTIELTIK